MIFTLPNLIRHFLNVFVGRAENSLRVLQSVMRHGKISLKENASSFTNVLRTSSLRTVASYQEAKQAQCSAFMPSSGSLRSLPKTLWSPGTFLLLFCVSRARGIVIIIQRIQARGDIFLEGKFLGQIIPEVKVTWLWHFGAILVWVEIVQKLGSFSFSSSFSLLFSSFPFPVLSFPIHCCSPTSL